MHRVHWCGMRIRLGCGPRRFGVCAVFVRPQTQALPPPVFYAYDSDFPCHLHNGSHIHAVLEILLLCLRQLPAGTVPHGALRLVGRFFLTISNSLAYTINRRLSIGLSAFGGLVDVGM